MVNNKYINIEEKSIKKTDLMKDIRDGRIAKTEIETFLHELDSLWKNNQIDAPYSGESFRREKKQIGQNTILKENFFLDVYLMKFLQRIFYFIRLK